MLAKEFGHSEWEPSLSWSVRLCKRYSVRRKRLFGEAAAADKVGRDFWLSNEWPDMCKRYIPEDIFNADETGLFYRMVPTQTLAFPDDLSAGGKKNKERVSILLCSNMSGNEKLKPFVIGKYAKPRCFKKVNVSNLVKYAPQNSSWMTSDLFESWLRDVNRKMGSENRHILLLVDNASCHNSAVELELSNVEVQFLPKNTTSILQPMDMGIIAATKVIYRKHMCRAIINELDKGKKATAPELAKKLTLLQGIQFLVDAWNAVTESTLVNCWRKAGLCSGPERNDEVEIVDLNDIIETEMNREAFDRWVKCDEFLQTGPSGSIDEIVREVNDKFQEEEKESSDEEEVEVEVKISNSEALALIESLKKFYNLHAKR